MTAKMGDEESFHTADGMLKSLPQDAGGEARKRQYEALLKRLELLLQGYESCSVTCALHIILMTWHRLLLLKKGD